MTLIGLTTFAKLIMLHDGLIQLVHIKLYSIWNLQHVRKACIFNGERVALTVY